MVLNQLWSRLRADKHGFVYARDAVNLLKTRNYRNTYGNIELLLRHVPPIDCKFSLQPGARTKDRSEVPVDITLEQYFQRPRAYIVKLDVKQVAAMPEMVNLVTEPGIRRRSQDISGPYLVAGLRQVDMREWLKLVATPQLACVFEGVLCTTGRFKHLVGPIVDEEGNEYPDAFLVPKVAGSSNFDVSEGSVGDEHKKYGEILFQILLILADDQVADLERIIRERLRAKFGFPFKDALDDWKKELIVYPPGRRPEVWQVFNEVAEELVQTIHAEAREVEELKLALPNSQRNLAQRNRALAETERRLAETEHQLAEAKRQLAVAQRQLQLAGLGPVPEASRGQGRGQRL